MIQFIAFIKWMARRAVALPFAIIQWAFNGFSELCEMLYHEGAGGLFLGFLLGIMSFLVGMLFGLAVETITHSGKDVPLVNVLMHGVATACIFEAAVFFKVCWIAFINDQQRVINNLKE